MPLFRMDVVFEDGANMDKLAEQAADSIDLALQQDEGHRGKRSGDVRLYAQFLDENRNNVAIFEADYTEDKKFNAKAKQTSKR